jgi:hypothetical protein
MRTQAARRRSLLVLLLGALLALGGCDACEPAAWWGPDEMVGEGEGEGEEGEGEGEGEGEEGEGEEGEGEVEEGEGEEGEGEGEGEGQEGEGEGEEGEGEGEGGGEGEGEGEGSGGAGTVWVEIDYTRAFTPQSPAWRFSNTPGFGPAQWAMTGGTHPEAWDRFNNMAVVNDPIGTSLELDGELQLMMGLLTLQSYDRAVVRLEGRARETSSSVRFDVFNPLNGCGVGGMSMANDWSIHVVEIDLGTCLLPGRGVQAVRVDPTSGTMALVRMRVTLEGAVY